REVAAEDGAGGGGEVERPVLDQRYDRERSEALRSARDAELRLDRVRDHVRAVREPEGLRELDPAAALDVRDAREARAPGECVDGFGERRHRAGDRTAAGRAEPDTVYATASGGSSPSAAFTCGANRWRRSAANRSTEPVTMNDTARAIAVRKARS